MVPNVNQITSKLATLNDQQLQQYAQMHQDDAYVLALAVSEKNRRAALRNNAQAQPAPQGTVAEQEVAEMAPAGISTLEAPAIDELGMAGGGVVGYQEGGALDEQAAQDRASLRRLWESLTGASEDAGRAILDVGALPIRGLAGAYDTAVVRPMRAAGIPAGYLSPLLVPEGVSPESMTPFTDVKRVRTPDVGVPDTGDQGARLLKLYPAPTATSPTVVQAPDKLPAADRAGGAPRITPDQPALETAGIGAGRVPVTGGAPAETPAQPAELGGLAGLRQMMDTNSKEVAALQERQQANTKAYYDGLAADAAAEQTEFKERTKDQDKTFDEKRGRISERQAELDKERKQARAFAIIRAGLAMMSGESPYALVNIGRGAQEGLRQFAVDTQRIDKAREGLREELDKIAELQLQMRSATGEKLSQLKKEERKIKRDGEFKAVELATAAGLENAREQGKVLWSGVVGATIKEITADTDFKRDMQKLAYQRGTSLQQARISAGGRDSTVEAKRAKAYSDAVKTAQEAAQKDIRWMAAKDNEARVALVREYLDASLQLDPYVGEGAFVKTPASGAQVLRSSAMPK